MDKRTQPTLGKYLVSSRPAALALQVLDTALCCLPRPKQYGAEIRPPESILISNIAALGDVVIATCVAATIKSAFPDVRIGLLCASWTKPIAEHHPLISRVHILDHFLLNRGAQSWHNKLRSHVRTQEQALRQIREAGYDVAIELMARMHNTVPLLWRAGIPVRIGYRSGGFGRLLTHTLEWKDNNQHASRYHLDLLRFLPIPEEQLSKAHAVLPSSSPDNLQRMGVDTSRLAVFHTQAGVAFKQWRAEAWRELARMCSADGCQVVFTGLGADQAATISSTLNGLDGCMNLCNQLSWDDFVSAIEHAQFVVCVDTVAQHIASAFDTPCVAILPGPNPHIYYPMHERHRVLIAWVDCIPCFRPYGCEGMDCIRNVGANMVYDAIQELLHQPHGSQRTMAFGEKGACDQSVSW